MIFFIARLTKLLRKLKREKRKRMEMGIAVNTLENTTRKLEHTVKIRFFLYLCYTNLNFKKWHIISFFNTVSFLAFYHERAAFYHEKRPFLAILSDFGIFSHLWLLSWTGAFLSWKNTVFGHFFEFRHYWSFVAFYHEQAAFYHEKKTVFGHFFEFLCVLSQNKFTNTLYRIIHSLRRSYPWIIMFVFENLVQ